MIFTRKATSLEDYNSAGYAITREICFAFGQI